MYLLRFSMIFFRYENNFLPDFVKQMFTKNYKIHGYYTQQAGSTKE